ncbi:cell division protein FtsQ/DivIB [Priestia taiwanensis]|uniref:Cell division protein DivIB n=1 Tax=Priestia taiwanensis TaxID=1347902 RepID=A0A917APR6_9BACI|nr:FtsQ-type POTRA domain-containing protein [Priestia taiwanensis]MBM7362933.1 cell division protein FtsQ [Priestia taiwanensis]GGE66276.1 cell division protein DivIB [Priestia taiwanensis]
MEKEKVIDLGERIPRLKQELRRKSNYRLVFYIFFFFFVMIAVLYFQIAFGNISKIEVEGNKYVTKEEVIQLSGLKNETSYWKISEEAVEAEIKKHGEIQSAKVTKKFPNNIYIKVEEYGTVGYLMKGSSYHPVLENGKVLDVSIEGEFPVQAPLLYDFREKEEALEGETQNPGLQFEELQELAAEMAILPESIRKSISEIYYTPKEKDALSITLFMSEGFEVHVTINDFANKMLLYPAIAEDKKHLKGIINLEKGAYYAPYETAE